ncbi:EAL domain-containing protein [Desulfosporosinus fructosivorans]|nr:EAL domain-containing protein [Desulfosporosinus fructosivorans]
MEYMLSAYAYHRIITDINDMPVDYEFLEINSAYELMTGLKQGDIIGRRIMEIDPGIINDDVNWLEFYGNVALTGQPGVIEHYSQPSNQWFLVHTNSTRKGYFSAHFIDVTTLKQKEFELVKKNNLLVTAYEQVVTAENKLKKEFEDVQNNKELTQDRYREIVENSNDIIYSCGLDGTITSVNKSFCTLAAKTAKEIIGANISQFLKLEETNMAWNTILLKGIITNTGVTEHGFTMQDGSVRHYQITLFPIFDVHRKIIEVIGINHDITTSKHNEQKIMLLAYRDSLTNLPNKNLFLDRLNTSISTYKRTASKAAVILVDLDDFKKINSSLGYKVGDAILVEAAKKLVSCMRDYDTVARVGEDNFLLLFQDIKHNNELFPIINRLKKVLGDPYNVHGKPMNITASLGISVFPDDGVDSEAILMNADKAMYKAKELGKNGYYFFNNDIKEGLERKIKLETMLNNAISNQEFELHYQPQYEARTRRLRGFEALIRWNNPEVGLVMPMEFIPFAEETGLIVPIGSWVLNTACKLCHKLNKAYGLNLNMSVNISPIQIKQQDFYEVISQVLEHSGIEPSNLELEVPESAFNGIDNVLSVLKVLKDDGIRITLTDFGTGKLSISDLKKLPINMVKLDKEFIHEIDQPRPQDALAESIISLVHKLNIELIAGGVETKKQFDYLIKGNCDNIQGYFFEEPVPEKMLEGIITKGILENEALTRVIQKAGLTYEGFVKQEMLRIGRSCDTKL